MITFISFRKTRSFRKSLRKRRRAMEKRKTRKRANITLNFAIAKLASLGTTEGGLVGGLEVDLGAEEGTILEEGIVGGTMPPGQGHKPSPSKKRSSPTCSIPPPPSTTQMTGEVITREYTIYLQTMYFRQCLQLFKENSNQWLASTRYVNSDFFG